MLLNLAFLAVSGGLSGWLPVICLIVGLILFGIAAFWSPPVPGWNRLVAAGLFFWILATIIIAVGGL